MFAVFFLIKYIFQCSTVKKYGFFADNATADVTAFLISSKEVSALMVVYTVTIKPLILFVWTIARYGRCERFLCIKRLLIIPITKIIYYYIISVMGLHDFERYSIIYYEFYVIVQYFRNRRMRQWTSLVRITYPN